MTKLNFETFSNIVNGQLRGAQKQYHSINPFTEEQLWPAPVATQDDLNDAVDAAQVAFKNWRTTSVEERRRCFKAFAEALMAQKIEFAAVVEKEAGQPTELADSEIDAAYEWLETIPNIDLPEYTTHEDDEVIATTKFFPLGVVAAICPWNFPLFLAAGKIAGAVSTGNTVIVKPSPFTPYSTLKLVELAQAYFPPGVIQALGGDDSLGPWMTTHPGIAKISFTGSGVTGKKILAAAAPMLKRVTLELGGNDAAIICADVDVDDIAAKMVEEAFSHASQVCISSKRIYVHSSIYPRFLVKFAAHVATLIPGQGTFSPIQNQMQYDKVASIIADSVANGHTFALGPPDLSKANATSRGYFLTPSIVSNPPETSRIVQEEPFGPIVPVLEWTSEDEVIARANDTDQGLGAMLWTRDREQAARMAPRLEAGSVWVNRGAMPLATAHFGGIKQSGLGGDFGPLGLANYCDARTFHFAK